MNFIMFMVMMVIYIIGCFLHFEDRQWFLLVSAIFLVGNSIDALALKLKKVLYALGTLGANLNVSKKETKEEQ